MPVVVVPPAEIDVTNSELVHQRIVAALTPGVDVVIADMTSTTFCDSSGVHAVVFAHESRRRPRHRVAAGGLAGRLGAPGAAADRRRQRRSRFTPAWPRRWTGPSPPRHPVRRATIIATSSSLEPSADITRLVNASTSASAASAPRPAAFPGCHRASTARSSTRPSVNSSRVPPAGSDAASTCGSWRPRPSISPPSPTKAAPAPDRPPAAAACARSSRS